MQPFDIYDALIEGLPAGLRVKSYINGKIWTMAEKWALALSLLLGRLCFRKE